MRQFDRNARTNPEQEYQANGWIRSPTVRVTDEDGNQIGIMDTKAALQMAKDQGLDLITIARDAEPPVCRLYELSKWIYEQKKVKKEQEKKNRENAIVIKELQIRPGINEHDLLIKQRHAKEFLEDNNKIKIVMRFRGREMAFTNRGFELIRKFLDGLGDHRIEKEPSMAGNTLMVILAPVKSVKS
jgi:translation initiation factor IF-3